MGIEPKGRNGARLHPIRLETPSRPKLCKDGCRVSWFFKYALLLMLSAAIVYPMSIAVAGSFKSFSEFYTNPARLAPIEPTLDGWRQLAERVPMGRWMANSFYVAFLGMFMNLALAAPAAYAFSRLRFPGSELIFRIVVATLMLPLGTYLVPLYTVFRSLGLLNTLFGVAIPVQESVLGVFLLTQFFRSVPKELEEAALIDGCTRWQTFTRVFLPLVKPGLVTLVIYTFVWKWNMFLWPLIALNSSDQYTAALGIPLRLGSYVADTNIMLAGATLVAAPVLILYAVFQRGIIATHSTTGLKG